MHSATPSNALIRALKRALYPLVRLMLAKNVGYLQLAELLKSVFVEVADREFSLDGKRQSDSRISLLTGIHRKDVKRLRESPPDENAVINKSVSLGAQLVATWAGLPEYQDAEGNSLPLRRLAGGGGGLSFEGLVTSVSKDVRSRAVLDEWLRLGIVHLDADDYVILNVQAFVPTQGTEEKLFYFGHNLHDHGAAATQNVIGTGLPFLDRCVHYNGVSAGTVEKIAAAAEKYGMETLLAVNRLAAAETQPDPGTESGTKRFSFGVYFYSTSSEDTPPDA
jgi:hypothetical protein